MFCEVGLLAFGCCALLDLLPCNETAFSHLTQVASVYESTRKHQPHHSCLPSIYKRSWSLTFSSVEGLKACEWFLIGVIRPKRYHEIVVNGDICLVARSLLSVCTILSTQRSQGPPTRAQLQNGQTNLPDEHRALLFPTCCHGLDALNICFWRSVQIQGQIREDFPYSLWLEPIILSPFFLSEAHIKLWCQPGLSAPCFVSNALVNLALSVTIGSW